MNRFTSVGLMLSGLVLVGCVNHRYCLEPQGYENAGSIPPLQSADGLTVPKAPGALVVPAPPANKVPFGYLDKTAKGKTQVECLDQPPPMPKPQGNEITE